MKVSIDAELCTGHGRCAAVAAEFYRLDDNGYNAERGKTLDVPAGLEAIAKHGARHCPERAIKIVENNA